MRTDAPCHYCGQQDWYVYTPGRGSDYCRPCRRRPRSGGWSKVLPPRPEDVWSWRQFCNAIEFRIEMSRADVGLKRTG